MQAALKEIRVALELLPQAQDDAGKPRPSVVLEPHVLKVPASLKYQRTSCLSCIDTVFSCLY
jgi:hypothetical protein